MLNIVVENVPESIFEIFGSKISYDQVDPSFFIKKRGLLSKNFISPDLKFTSYNKMNEKHKKKYDEVLNIDKSDLINI